MHRIHGNDDENMHDVVRVQIVVQAPREPLFGDVHRADCSTKYGNTILNEKISFEICFHSTA